jgi:hypothetical protein
MALWYRHNRQNVSDGVYSVVLDVSDGFNVLPTHP